MARKGETAEATEQYRQRIMDIVCAAIATSNKGLKRICDAAKQTDPNFPHKCTIMDWLRDSEELSNQYARAKALQADFLVDEIIEIADDDSQDELFVGGDDESGEGARRVANNEFIQRSRLKVDARKWVASKLAPKKYGDKQIIAGDPDNPLLVSRVERVIVKPNPQN